MPTHARVARPEAAPAATPSRSARVPLASPVPAALGILQLQRVAGNSAVTARLRTLGTLQRQPAPVKDPPKAPPLVKRPEDTTTYEQWLASFSSLSTFSASDTAPDGFGTGHKVFGDPKDIASHDPNASADDKQADPLFQTSTQKFADHFIDHPTNRWVRENLPPELVETAYRLPTDCADIVVILRHVWLFVHNRTERHGSWVLGVGAGSTLEQRQRNLNQTITEVTSGNVAALANSYVDKDGKQLKSFAQLQKVLHPGDILVWEHKKRTKSGGFVRSGGHSQTIISITRSAGGAVTRIDAAQGNEPIGKDEAEEIRKATNTKNPAGPGQRDPLRDQPGRRIEKGKLEGERLQDGADGVWTWDVGTDTPTVLVAAGPAASAHRAGGKAGKLLGRPQDWLPVFKSARRDTLQPTLEAALEAARGQIEGGGEVTAELANKLGEAAGGRFFALARQKPPLDDATRQAQISQLLGVITAFSTPAVPGSASATALSAVFAQIRSSFDASARRNEVQVSGVRRIPVDSLTQGFQPKGGGGAKAIVLVPVSLGISSTTAPPDVQVLLHLHGVGADLSKGASSRDVTIDQIESQLAASGRPMVGVLPQGSSKPRFGGDTFDADALVGEVFTRLTALGVWPSAPKVSQTVLTAHSGGGFSITEGGMLGSSNQPSKLGEVALFDSINGPNELDAVENWLFNKQIPADIARLKAAANDVERTQLLPKMLRFRAYHHGTATGKATRKVVDYEGLHRTLQQDLDTTLNTLATSSGLSPAIFAGLRTHYQVIAVGGPGTNAQHDTMVGQGHLQDALANAPTP